MTSPASPPSPQPLYAAREPVFPRRVSGRFRNLKWGILVVTLAVYYITPWLRWNRGEGMPDQAVLVDLANRRFYFFFIEIWPHEFYFVAGLLIMAGLGLFLFTSALGRVWCGYTCPQTVWTDLMILVERWVEGDRNARLRLWNQGWDARKVRLRLTKWVLWLLIGLATGGAWVFYFTDAPTLARALLTFQAPAIAWITIAILTATTVTFGGFMREQVCIYMCPWPRIQAAMMDEDTLTVAYRPWRGEPRGKAGRRPKAPLPAAASGSAELRRSPSIPVPGLRGPVAVGASGASAAAAAEPGDCIDCFACVNVCPMGIDIRDGQQLACITCALCIDACDDVMDKIGKPRGLIGYMALKDEVRERAGEAPIPAWRHVLRPRTLLYTALWSLVGVGLVVALLLRPAIDITVSPVRNPTFVTLSNGDIRNTYDLRIRNKNAVERQFAIALSGADGLRLEVEGAESAQAVVPANQLGLRRVYVIAPSGSAAATGGQTALRLSVTDSTTGASADARAVFHGAGP